MPAPVSSSSLLSYQERPVRRPSVNRGPHPARKPKAKK